MAAAAVDPRGEAKVLGAELEESDNGKAGEGICNLVSRLMDGRWEKRQRQLWRKTKRVSA